MTTERRESVRGRRERRLPETKTFALTSEFWVFVVGVAGMLFAGYVLDDIADPNYQVHMIQSSSPVYLNTGKKATSSASVSIFLRAGTLHQVVLVNRFSTGGKTGAVTARLSP